MPLPDSFLPWLTDYGSFALFSLLALGIFGLPIPDETLMVLSGYLIVKGQLGAVGTIIACLSGSICGITLSYWLGRLAGDYLTKKIGHWIGVTEERLARVRGWFERIGKWTLFLGYFIPGLRHFTGYVAGATHLDYKRFALFAYSGAVVWVATFLSLGYFFGEEAEQAIERLDTDVLMGLVILAAITWFFIFIRKKCTAMRSRNNN